MHHSLCVVSVSFPLFVSASHVYVFTLVVDVVVIFVLLFHWHMLFYDEKCCFGVFCSIYIDK